MKMMHIITIEGNLTCNYIQLKEGINSFPNEINCLQQYLINSFKIW